jgi:hypothetical protein
VLATEKAPTVPPGLEWGALSRFVPEEIKASFGEDIQSAFPTIAKNAAQMNLIENVIHQIPTEHRFVRLDVRRLVPLNTDGGRNEGAGHEHILQTCGVANLPRLIVNVSIWAVVSSVSYCAKVAADMNEVSRQPSWSHSESVKFLYDSGCASYVHRRIHPSCHRYYVRLNRVASLLDGTTPVANVGFHERMRERHNNSISIWC